MIVQSQWLFLLIELFALKAVAVDSFAAFSINHKHGTATCTNTRFAHQLLSPACFEVESHADWLELLDPDDDDNNNDQQVTLVWFKSPWCKTCKRFEREWKRKILPLGGYDNNLQLATLDVYSKRNSKLCKELNVQALPTVQFYYRGDLLTSFSCCPKEFSRVEQAVDHYLEASPGELELEASFLEGKTQPIRFEEVSSIEAKKSDFSART